MNTEKIIMCVVALLIGMLVANMLTNVCGCKTGVEGFSYSDDDKLIPMPDGDAGKGTVDDIYGAGALAAQFGREGHGCGGFEDWVNYKCSDLFTDNPETSCESGVLPTYKQLDGSRCGQGFVDADGTPILTPPDPDDLCPLCGWKTCGKGNCYWRGPLGSDGLEPTTLPGTGAPGTAVSGQQFKPCPNWDPNRNPAPLGNGACCPGAQKPKTDGSGCE